MTILDEIKLKVKKLYSVSPDIHINFINSFPKIYLSDEPAKIIGVYKNVFVLEEYSKGSPNKHTFQYTDILTNQLEIIELKDIIL